MIAVYQPCRRVPIHYPELPFPAARIVNDRFQTTYTFVQRSRSLYARVTVSGVRLRPARPGHDLERHQRERPHRPPRRGVPNVERLAGLRRPARLSCLRATPARRLRRGAGDLRRSRAMRHGPTCAQTRRVRSINAATRRRRDVLDTRLKLPHDPHRGQIVAVPAAGSALPVHRPELSAQRPTPLRGCVTARATVARTDRVARCITDQLQSD